MTLVSDGEEADAESAAYAARAMMMATTTTRAVGTTTDGEGGDDEGGGAVVVRGRRRRRRRVEGGDGRRDDDDDDDDEDDEDEDIGGRGADERDADADAMDDRGGEDDVDDDEDETARIGRLGPRGRASVRGGGTTGRRGAAPRVTETTEDDEEEEEYDDEFAVTYGTGRRGAKREIGHLAVWSVASAKPGNGVELLRDDDLGTFWQSDGAQPHLISAQFQHKAEMSEIALWCEYKMDESYTPSLVSVRAGTSCHDLREVRCVELERPNGWVRVPLGDADDSSCIRAYFIQVAILANHQNGRDTHVRQIKVFGPRRDQARALGRSRQLDWRSTEFSRYAGVR
jgi:anaphase-promoting complex subunit 10